MLSKIQSTVLLLVSSAYAAFQIWNYIAPIGQELVVTVVNAIFAVLAVFFGATKTGQAFIYNITTARVERFKNGG